MVFFWGGGAEGGKVGVRSSILEKLSFTYLVIIQMMTSGRQLEIQEWLVERRFGLETEKSIGSSWHLKPGG